MAFAQSSSVCSRAVQLVGKMGQQLVVSVLQFVAPVQAVVVTCAEQHW